MLWRIPESHRNRCMIPLFACTVTTKEALLRTAPQAFCVLESLSCAATLDYRCSVIFIVKPLNTYEKAQNITLTTHCSASYIALPLRGAVAQQSARVPAPSTPTVSRTCSQVQNNWFAPSFFLQCRNFRGEMLVAVEKWCFGTCSIRHIRSAWAEHLALYGFFFNEISQELRTPQTKSIGL